MTFHLHHRRTPILCFLPVFLLLAVNVGTVVDAFVVLTKSIRTGPRIRYNHCTTPTPEIGFLFSSLNGKEDSPSSSNENDEAAAAATELCHRWDLTEAFDRWRFLQKLLDLEITCPHDVNAIVYHVLRRYAQAPRDAAANQGAPERTRERLRLVQTVLHKAADHDDKSVPVLVPPDFVISQELERLLPDPVDEEDAHQSIYDGLVELHGREAVKIDERNGGVEWKASCLAARILLFYDFLQKGLLLKEDDNDGDL